MGVERFIYKPRIKNLVLVLLNGDYPSVNYDEDDDLRLYTLRCPLQYKSFIQSLQPTTVLLQYNTLTELSQLLNVLQNRHVIVSMDPKAVSEISTKSIITIQLVRYLCQKYHCDLISMKNFEASIAGVGKLLILVSPSNQHTKIPMTMYCIYQRLGITGARLCYTENQLRYRRKN